MALEQDRYCPSCGADRPFYRAAATSLHLGEKIKWVCTDCGHVIVLINDVVDTTNPTSS